MKKESTNTNASFISRSRTLAAAALLFGAATAFLNPAPAQAQWVVTDPGHTVQTILSEAKRAADAAADYANQAQQLQTQLQQYQNMVTQGLSLPNSIFNQLTNDLAQLQNLYQQSAALAGQLSNFDQEFRAQFRDYEQYLSQAGDPSLAPGNYKRWSEQGFDSMRVAMHAAGMNVSAIADEDVLLNQLVQRSASSEGRLQAIQAGNEIAAQQVQQTQKLRQMINAQVQSQSQYYAQYIERDTIEDAKLQRFRADRVQPGIIEDY